MLYVWLIVAGWLVVGYYSCGLLIALVGMAVGVWLVLLRFGLAVVLLFAAGVGFLLLDLGFIVSVDVWVA